MVDERHDDDAELRKFDAKRAKRMFWLALIVLLAFLVPQIVMMWYAALTGKPPL
jgi:cytochrome b subunit of formate dehydrogenase